MEKLVFKVLIMIAILVIAVSTVAQAATFVASMTPSNSSVAPATEVIVVVKISNLDVGQNGINALSGIIQYDTSIFETINSSSIEGLNEWKPSYSSENGKITLTKTQFVKSDEEVFQITLKTKSAETFAKKKNPEGAVTFRSIVASNSEQDITSSDISTTIKIATEDATNTTNNTANSVPLNATTNNNTVNNTISLQNKVNNTVNNTVANSVPIGTKNITNNTNNAVSTYNTTNSTNDNMPYTGVEDTLVYVMLAVIAIALVFYFKFEKINRDMR